MLKRLLITLFLLLISISIVSSIAYYSHSSLFTSQILKIDVNHNYDYIITLQIDNTIAEELKYEVEIIYNSENLISGYKTFNCKISCLEKIPISKTIFGEYTVIITTVYQGRHYKQEIPFHLELDKKLSYEVFLPKIINLNPDMGIEILGKIKSQNKNSLMYTFEIFPNTSKTTKSIFTKDCTGNCDFYFNINSQIVIDNYIVNIYTPLGDLQRQFILKLPYEELPKEDSKNNKEKEEETKFNKIFKNSTKEDDLDDYFFYNNITKTNLKINVSIFDKKGKRKDKKNITFQEIVDLDIDIENSSVRNIKIPNAKVGNLSIGFENVPLEKIVEFEKPVNAFAIDPTRVNPEVKSFNLTFTASSNTLYKCKDYNFTTQVCFGNFVKVMDTIPGKNYTLVLTPEDPLFVEIINPTYNVQRGSVTSTATTFTATIPSSIIMNNTLILMNPGTSDSNPNDWQYTQSLLNPTTIQFDRYAGGGTSTTIKWQTIESNQFFVQRGTRTFTTAQNALNITLSTPINTSSSFVVVEGRCNSGTTNNNHAGFFLGEIKNPTTIQIERGQSTLCAATATWQVVDYKDAKVQSKRVSFGTTGTTLGDTLSSQINLSNSFIIFGVSASSGTDRGMDTNMIHGQIDTSNSVLFTRAADVGTSNRDIFYYIIEHSNILTKRNVLSTTIDVTETLTPPVNMSKAFHRSSVTNSGGGQSYANVEYTMELISSSSLFFDKITTGNTQGVSWEVIEFFPSTISKFGEVVLNSTSGLNLDMDNLTCNYILDSNIKSTFVNWLIDGNSIMVGAYPFEGGVLDSLNDYSNNSNNGINSGATWSSTSGYDGNGSFSFNGNSNYINLSNSIDFDLTTDITLMGWAKMLGQSIDSDYSRIISKGQSTTTDGAYSLIVSDPTINYIGCRIIDSVGTNHDVTLTDGTENDNLWHHITCTYNGSLLRLYVDGVEKNNLSSVFTIKTTTDYLTIGDGAGQRHFNGLIDDVRIYDRAVSSNQISNIFNKNLNQISFDETIGRENWMCTVQTFDNTKAGELYASESLKILSTNIPNVINVILTAQSQTNYTNEDLTCNYDIIGSTTEHTINWFLNGTSILNLNMPFEGNSTNALRDYSNNSNNGNVNVAIWNETQGYNGSSAYVFNGSSNQYIDLGQSSTLFYDGDSNYTFSFWIKTNQTLNDPPLISDKNWALGFNNGYSIHLEGGVCRINIGDGVNRVDLDGTISINDNNWHQCTFVLQDNSNVSLYVDGILDTQTDMTSINGVNSSLPSVIGNDGTKNYATTFKGILDNVQIYNLALSSKQVLNLFNNSDILSQDETNIDDTWMCSITPFDQYEKGTTKYSNSLIILEAPPIINLNLTQPLTDTISVYKGTANDIIFNVSCLGPTDCNNVNLTLNYLAQDQIGESGKLLLSNNTNYTIVFNKEYSKTPVIMAVAATDNLADNNPLIPVIHSINKTHAVVSLCEDAGATTCSTVVEEEELDYFIFDIDEANKYSWIDVGYINNINTNGAANAFSFNKTFTNTPYIFTQSQTYNSGSNAIAPHAWFTSPTITGANIIGCDHPGIVDTCVGTSNENYGYVAIDTAFVDIIGLNIGTQSIASSAWTPITFTDTYSNPVIMVSQNSENGAQDPQYQWAQLVTSTSAEIRYCEADAAGVCDSHSAEDIRWFTLEEGYIEVNNLVEKSISNLSSTIPIYVDSLNPKTFNLNATDSTEISFPLYFTGDFNSTYEIYATVDYGDNSRHFNATILPSYIIINYMSPSDNSVVVQNETFQILTNVSCIGFCGEIISESRLNGTTINTTINAIPIYTTDYQPQWCNPGIDGSCLFSWNVNATGSVGSNLIIDVLVNSSVFGLNDTFNSNLMIVSGPEVLFNTSFVNITSAIASYQEDFGYAKIEAFLFNQTNVTLTCENGDCNYFTHNFTNGMDMNVGTPSEIKFACLPANSGTSSAQFSVKSNEDSSLDFLNISCYATELQLYVNLIDPNTDVKFDILQNTTFNVSMNVTCNTVGGCNNTQLGLYYERDTIGETGSVLLSNFESKQISFIRSYTTIPIVIPIAATDNLADNNPLIPVITDISTTGFNIALCEDAGATTCSAVVEEEEVHYYVFDVDVVANQTWIDVGYVNNIVSDGLDNAITFSKTFTNTPYVFAWTNTDNDGGNAIAPTNWLHTITTNGAQLIGCDHPGTADACAGSTTENYSYVAIDVINANIGELSYGSQSISNSLWTPVSFTNSYTNPRLLVSQNSDTGAQDPQYPWAQAVTSSSAQVRYCEADTGGYCDTHSAETIVWLALEDGLINLGSLSSSLVSTIGGSTPYYTTSINPYITNFTENTTQQIIFLLNATGTIDAQTNMYGLLSNGIDSKTLTVRTTGFNELLFLDISLNFSTVYETEGSGVISTTLSSRYENNNVSINCIGGDCPIFSNSWANGNNLVEAQNKNINFLCSDTTIGNFSALFDVTSNNADVTNIINLSCSVLIKPLDIDLYTPYPFNTINVSLYSNFNLTFNVTCNNTSGCNNVVVYPGIEDELKVWWNRSWPYKQDLELNSIQSSTFNYTFLLELNSSNVKSKFDWNLACEDLRFIYNDYVELNYWIESCSYSNQNARIWIKTNTPLDSFKLYNFSMYYGNKLVTTTSNGYNTFTYFDNFENYDGTIDGVTPPTWTTYTSGVISMYTEGDGNRVLSKNTNSDPNGGYSNIGNSISNFETIFLTNRLVDIAGGTANRYAISNSSSSGYGPYSSAFGPTTTFIIEERADGVGTTLATGSTFATTQNMWYRIKFRYFNQTINYSLYDLDNNLLNSLETTDPTVTSFTRFYIHGGQEFLTDDIAIREIISKEPTITFGNENYTYSQITNITKTYPFYIDGLNSNTINLINGESKLISFNVTSYANYNTRYEFLGYLSNKDRTNPTYIYVLHPKTNLNLNYNLNKKGENLYSFNLTLENKDNYSSVYNKSIKVYVFLSNKVNISSITGSPDSQRYNVTVNNETLNDINYNGTIFEWVLIPNLLREGIFSENLGIKNINNSWNLQFNLTTFNDYIHKDMILVGFDPERIIDKTIINEDDIGEGNSNSSLSLISLIQMFINIFCEVFL